MRLATLLLLLPSFACAAPPADLDAWVARAMKAFDVPGVAVAVVKDGRVEFARGYGVRKLGEPGRVDEHTVFGIASNTKAFTAAALALLVDEGKLSWDDPVQKHLPSFQLADPYVARELTVRDLLCHRSGLGLGAGDLLFWPDTDVTREQVVAAARYLRPSTSLRSKYAYNNLMFVVAGQVIAAVTGKPWDDFVRQRLLQPLHMQETEISSVRLNPQGNVAAPHSKGWRLEGTLTPISPTRDDTWAAAAGIKSSVSDLSKWVMTQLSEGQPPEGKRLWSEKAAREMWTPQTIVPIRKPAEPLKATQPHFAAYGLGWALRDYRGRKIVSHGGALTGMVSTVIMVPEEHLGLILLTNQEESGAYSAIAYHLLDHYLGLPQTDWVEGFTAARAELMKKAADAEQKQAAKRKSGTRPSLPLSGYAGTYADAWYGKITLAEQNGHLALQMARTPSLTASLEHWQYDTFVARWRDKTTPDAFVTFALDPDGGVDTVKLTAISTLADFSFDYDDLLFRPVKP